MFSCSNNLLWLWNLGFSCGFSLIIQMMTGLLLAFRYETKEANIAMEKLESLCEGWMWSKTHSTGSTMYFMTMYLHMWSSMISSCAMYYTWLSGCMLYFISFATALVGYSLTSGNMAQWALTVVSSVVMNLPKGTSMFSIMLGDYGVSEKMIPSIYTMHFLLGIITPMMMMWHMNEVHKKEFSSDIGMSNSIQNKEFLSSGFMKDMFMSMNMLMFMNQGMKENSFMWKLIEDENANDWPQIAHTPEPIGPEWYMLFLFAILKMTSLNKLMINIMIMMIVFLNMKYNKTMFLIILIGKLMMLGYLALNAHISLEEPKMMAKNVLMMGYLTLMN